MNKKLRKFQCGMCKKSCATDIPKAEVLQEGIENGFIESAGVLDSSDMMSVCDNCYKKLARRFNFAIK